jgi:nucleobase transporter 1/2
MREIQGAIILSSIFQVFVGFFGIVGMIVRFITPITVAAAILTLGISLFKVGGEFAASNWAISLSTIALAILFSQYLGHIKLSILFTKSLKREGNLRYPFFQVLPIFLSIMVMWFICFILTSFDWLPEDSEARTDAKSNILKNASWFRVPYPFQWGIPTFSASTVFGMLAGVIAGIVESVGDYYACARIVGARPPPVHSVNRGILVEGLGCIIAGIWGTGNGTTSYSENIGAISLTRVGSRRVIQVTGLVMMVCSLFAKVGGIFVSVPRPIVGGVVCVSFSIIAAVGISNLKSVNLNSVRNLFVIGFSTFFGLAVSQWVERNPGHIDVGSSGLNQILEVILRTGIFLAGSLALVLDNTIPGNSRDRGLLDWPGYSESTENSVPSRSSSSEFDAQEDETYDLPFGMEYLQNASWTSWLPISPSFKGENYSRLFQRSKLCKRRKIVDVAI